ncbi:MAG TPA: antitoxin [Oceanicaulis sp.]|nr:antitoxin [Oceanicaulis sp.]
MAVQEHMADRTALEQALHSLGLGPLSVGALSDLDLHSLLSRGFPIQSFEFLVESFPGLTEGDRLKQAIGVSKQTLARRRGQQAELRTSRAESDRIWRFAMTAALATEVLGTNDHAVEWLFSAAMALDNNRPVELIGTIAGFQAVQDHLKRMKYGVYT